MSKLTFYPIGNADSCLIDLEFGQKILFDYGNQRDPDDEKDKRCDLAEELRKNLKAAKRDNLDVVAFSHLDRDHYERATEFFWLEHAEKYQGEGRIKIRELWVPAAVITEQLSKEEDTVEAKTIQAEARYRMKQGKGIRVFSRPDALAAWLKKQGLALKDRQHLITDAGQIVPTFNPKDHGVEFFVHSPFAKHVDDTEVVDRNTGSLVLHATFFVGERRTKVLIGSDTPYDVMQDIVNISKAKKNDARLAWDVFKLMHHCSYKSLAEEKGEDKTVPVDEVKELFEEHGQEGGIIVSSSCPIPVKGSKEDKDVQPPHRQAANYFRQDVMKKVKGEFKVTMEHPKVASPEPLVISITADDGALVEKQVATGVSIITNTSTPRAGRFRG
jgi:beta-lactamase superfamily II metal-dependent hydrolase